MNKFFDFISNIVPITGNDVIDSVIFSIITIVSFTIAWKLTGAFADSTETHNSGLMSLFHWLIRAVTFFIILFLLIGIANFGRWITSLPWWGYLIIGVSLVAFIALIIILAVLIRRKKKDDGDEDNEKDPEIEYLEDRMNRYLQTMGEVMRFDLDITIRFVEENIRVRTKLESPGKYVIEINKDFLLLLRCGVETYLEHIKEEDLNFLKINDKYEFYDNYNNFFPSDNPISKFYNHIASLMLDNIIRHEVGHIVLGHLESGSYVEESTFDYSKSFYYQNYEMQADWFGIIRSFSGNLTFDLSKKSFNIYHLEEYKQIKNLFFCCFLAIYVQHSMAFGNSLVRKELSDKDFIHRKHACELVRIRYNFDALITALSYVLQVCEKDTPEKCNDYALGMMEGCYEQLNNFIKYFDRYTFESINENKTINFYYAIIRLDK